MSNMTASVRVSASFRLANTSTRDHNDRMTLLKNFAQRLWNAYMGFQEHEGSLSAAGIAYYVALSFFPLLLVLLGRVGLGAAMDDIRPGCASSGCSRRSRTRCRPTWRSRWAE